MLSGLRCTSLPWFPSDLRASRWIACLRATPGWRTVFSVEVAEDQVNRGLMLLICYFVLKCIRSAEIS